MTPNPELRGNANGARSRPPAAGPAARPPAPEHPWEAEIVWDQHADDPMFQALAQREDGDGEAVIATSPRMLWPPTGTSDVNDLRDAVDQLETALLEAGWSNRGRGRQWYARRFAWQPQPGVDVAPARRPTGGVRQTSARRPASARVRPDERDRAWKSRELRRTPVVPAPRPPRCVHGPCTARQL